jgi:hypothetical protein
VRDGILDDSEFLAEFAAIQTRVRYWLTLGLTASSSRTAAICRLLPAADADLWRFVSGPGLEVVETYHQQQRPVFDFLRDTLIAYRTGQPASYPCLLPNLKTIPVLPP